MSEDPAAASSSPAAAAGMPPSASRRDLIETIDRQKNDLAKYEQRLKDVVRAYKGLTKEKEALEAGLKPAGAGGDALQAALAAVTEEKAALMRSYKDERRRNKAEREARESVVAALESELSSLKSSQKDRLEELKSRLIVERHERERETSDHAVQMRELQLIVAGERADKDRLESLLHDTQAVCAKLERDAAAAAGGGGAAGNAAAGLGVEEAIEAEARLTKVDAELAAKTELLERTEVTAAEAAKEIQRLRDESESSSAAHARALHAAEQRAADAQRRAAGGEARSEQRVVNLETRLQELSQTVGAYDRLRRQDQLSIERLKDRLQQLDAENCVLSREISRSPEPRSAAAAVEAVEAVVAAAVAAEKTDAEETSDEAHGREEYAKLRAEFESYKLQTQKQLLALSSPHALATVKARLLTPSDEQEVLHEDLRKQISLLTDRCSSLRAQLSETDLARADAESRERGLQDAAAALRLHAREAEAQFRSRTLALESELQKQRERCVKLIDEKDEEVRALKSDADAAFERAAFSFASSSVDAETDAAVFDAKVRLIAAKLAAQSPSSAKQNLTDDLKFTGGGIGPSSSAAAAAGGGGGGMVALHYVQELAHKDVQLRELRTVKHELELAMRELQRNFLTKEERYVEEAEANQDRIERLKRMATKEGANLEYLKNVVLNYMLSTEAASREPMLKAIGAVLFFSDADLRAVRELNASWWPATPKQNGPKFFK